jgi:hypothetical protein
MNESIDNMKITKINKFITKDSVPITNNKILLQKMIDYQTEGYKNNEKNLAKDLTTELNNLFGKSNKSIRLEFSNKLWILKYKDLEFYVYTSKKGTSIEICNYDYDEIRLGKKQDDIIEFLEYLYALVNNIPPEELNLRRAARTYNL